MDRLDTNCVNEVVCLDDPASSFLRDSPFIVHALGSGKGPWRRHPTLRPWLLKNLKRFDAVIVHGLWLYHSYAVTNAARRVRSTGGSGKEIRVFVMPHGMLDPWFQNDRSRRIKAARNWFYWKLIEQFTISNADGVLFTCERELELARTTFNPYRPRREVNVGYGVGEPPADSEAIRHAFREKTPALGLRPYLLFLSRIHPKKGVDLLIRAYTEVAIERDRSGLPTPDLVIAGPLDSQYAKAMQELAGSGMSKLPTCNGPGIYFPGMLVGDAKWGAFYGCEALVLPSHQENFGIAVVEALACGRPALITNQVNLYSDLEADGAAYVCDDTQGSVTDLINAWLHTPDERRREMAENARYCYCKRYQPETAARNLLAALCCTGRAP